MTIRSYPFLVYRRFQFFWLSSNAKMDRRIQRLRGQPLKIIVGSSNTKQEKWISTEKIFFDLTSSKSIHNFVGESKISNILAEHVIEHLTVSQFSKFLEIIPQFLLPDSIIRIAVPDALHPSPWYREQKGINGLEPGAEDHKTFWSYAALTDLCHAHDFQTTLLEWFDQYGDFRQLAYSDSDGRIYRSVKNYDGRLAHDHDLRSKLYSNIDDAVLQKLLAAQITYTSLIVDLKYSRNGS